MTVRVPAKQIDTEIESRLVAVGKRAKLKGFRPGKAPKKVIRQKFGKDVRQEVLSDVIRSSYSQAIVDQKLRPAGGPSIQAIPQADGEHFAYLATFEVYPEVDVGNLDKLSIETPDVEINDADVDDMIEKLRIQRAEWETVERKSAEGDRIVIDFEGNINGEPFAGGEGKSVTLAVGEGQVVADLDKALKGLVAGEKKSIKVKFPKDYHNEELASRKAVFDVFVHRVEARILPDVDDEFFAAFGVEEGGLDTLKTEVRSNMQRELNERLRAERKSRALDALLNANPVPVPRALIDEEIGHLQSDAMQRMGIQDPSHAPDREQFVELATRRVCLGLLVERVITDEEIELDRDRVDERIQELAAPYDKPQEAAQVYRTSKELMAQVESTVLEDQVVEYLLEKGKTKDKKVAFKDFMNT